MNDVAIVTGGSAGIGAAIAATLLERGASVIVLDRNPPEREHSRLYYRQVDLFDAPATEVVAMAIAAEHAVTHLVHNAGVILPNLLESVSPDDFLSLAQLHFGAATILLKAVLPGMKSRGFGRVVLMSSRAALGAATRSAYSATKAGLIGLGRTWALELAPHGVTVNMVAPGPIAGTQMFHGVVPAGSEQEASLARAIPVRRLGAPQDVANAVAFFCSREAGFVTGQTLYVCGGASIGQLTV
jgi:NAD(P)-dependent dehydrogenase (short-subunit alcohol dehydrogenase family)